MPPGTVPVRSRAFRPPRRNVIGQSGQVAVEPVSELVKQDDEFQLPELIGIRDVDGVDHRRAGVPEHLQSCFKIFPYPTVEMKLREIPTRAPRSPSGSRNWKRSFWKAAPVAIAAASVGSGPAMTPRSSAASDAVRAIGPAVSWLAAIGMIPPRLTSPTVGFMPTMPFIAVGQTMEPSVSVPTASGTRLA